MLSCILVPGHRQNVDIVSARSNGDGGYNELFLSPRRLQQNVDVNEEQGHPYRVPTQNAMSFTDLATEDGGDSHTESTLAESGTADGYVPRTSFVYDHFVFAKYTGGCSHEKRDVWEQVRHERTSLKEKPTLTWQDSART